MQLFVQGDTTTTEEAMTLEEKVLQARRNGYFSPEFVDDIARQFARVPFAVLEKALGIKDFTKTHDLPEGRLGYPDSPYYGRPTMKAIAKRLSQVEEMIEKSERRRQR